MNSISVETFINDASDAHEVLDGVLRNNNVHRGEGLLLIQTPNVEFMDCIDAGDLRIVSVSVDWRQARGVCLPFLDRGPHLPCQHR
jgi:hypothetical protein